jgi:hypothetical protein
VSGRRIGIMIMPMYASKQIPTLETTTVNTVWFKLDKNTQRPAKNRNTERCRNVGINSTTNRSRDLLRPSAKNARIRACLCRLSGSSLAVTLTYRCAHCCTNVADRAQVILITKLKNQSELTHTACFGTEKSGDGGDRVEEMETLYPSLSASSWRIFAR